MIQSNVKKKKRIKNVMSKKCEGEKYSIAVSIHLQSEMMPPMSIYPIRYDKSKGFILNDLG